MRARVRACVRACTRIRLGCAPAKYTRLGKRERSDYARRKKNICQSHINSLSIGVQDVNKFTNMPNMKEKQYVEIIMYFWISYIFNPFNYAYSEISIIDYFWIQNFVKFSLALFGFKYS